MKVNTYGLKMIGLKAAAGETKGISYYTGEYVQIAYDIDDGRVVTAFYSSVDRLDDGDRPGTCYGSIIIVCNATSPMTAQQIAAEIAERVAEFNEED